MSAAPPVDDLLAELPVWYKRHLESDPETKLTLTTHNGRVVLTATKFKKVFRIFEEYPMTWPTRAGFVKAMERAVQTKAPAIISYFG